MSPPNHHRDDSHDQQPVCIVDTETSLTLEELKELKQLARLSKTARWITAVVFAVVSLLGIDKIKAWAMHHQ